MKCQDCGTEMVEDGTIYKGKVCPNNNCRANAPVSAKDAEDGEPKKESGEKPQKLYD
jgi:hypothetical protein